MIEKQRETLSIRRLCQLLSLNRSRLYYKSNGLSDDTRLANELHELWLEMPFYGYRRITAELNRRGFLINGKRVIRLMREMNIQALYPRPRTSLRNESHKTYPYLLKDLSIEYPD